MDIRCFLSGVDGQEDTRLNCYELHLIGHDIPASQLICQQDSPIFTKSPNHLANTYAHKYKFRL